jgi:NADP-dependent 3-hydroxy acid dehydrogenase YdfG
MKKRVLISGGTGGIGLATARLLAGQGCEIFIFGRNDKKLKSALAEIKKIGSKAFGIVADTSTQEGLEKVFSEVDIRWGGKLDIYINNAGLGGGRLIGGSYPEWKNLVDVNILGYIAFAGYAVERMEKQKSGHIINIGSMSANTRDSGSDVYNATKAAVQAFSESLRKTVNPMGIKVSLIEPGSVGSDMPSEDKAGKMKLQKQNKMLLTDDIARAVLFCLSQPVRCDIITLQIKPFRQYI